MYSETLGRNDGYRRPDHLRRAADAIGCSKPGSAILVVEPVAEPIAAERKMKEAVRSDGRSGRI